MISFLLWLLYICLCAYWGSKRIIGAFDGAMLGVFFSFVGLMIVLASRRLDDDDENAFLLKKYKPLN